MLGFSLTRYENCRTLFKRRWIGSKDAAEFIDQRIETWDEVKRVGRNDRRNKAADDGGSARAEVSVATSETYKGFFFAIQS